MEFKDILRSLREEKHMTQQEIAKDMKVKPDNYNKWENGKSPNFETLAIIANYHNTSIDYLLGLTKARNPQEIDETNNALKNLSKCVIDGRVSADDLKKLEAMFKADSKIMTEFADTVLPLYKEMGKEAPGYQVMFSDYILDNVAKATSRCRLTFKERNRFIDQAESNEVDGTAYDLVLTELFLTGKYKPDDK